jgi:hypothetical protein
MLFAAVSIIKGKRPASMYISDIRQIVGYRTPVFIQRFPWRLHITITYNLPHLRLWYADVTVIALTPEVVCREIQTLRHEKDGTWSELTWCETTVSVCVLFINKYRYITQILGFRRIRILQLSVHKYFVISMLEFLIDNIFVSFGGTCFSRSSAYQWVRIVPLF